MAESIQRTRVIPLVFSFEKTTGGIGSSLRGGLRGREEKTIVIAPSRKPREIPDLNLSIIPTNPDKNPNQHLNDLWSSEWWSQMFPDAHSKAGYKEDLLKAMYQGSEYESPIGSFERILEHTKKYGYITSDSQIGLRFAERYTKAFHEVKPGSNILWQDFVFTPVILRFADELRAKGCQQSIHLHVSVPQKLHLSPFGQEMLLALSKVDTIFLHTNIFIERIKSQLSMLNLPIPRIEKFDLGPDKHLLRSGIERINENNFNQSAEYENLSIQQKLLIENVFDSKYKIPHRFITLDRVEPTKGFPVTLEAIEKYLDSLSLPIGELQKQFRFFFITPNIEKDIQTMDKYNLRRGYISYVQQALQNVQEKYPGIVFACDRIPNIYLPSLMDNAHIITGGIEEGLNLTIMEGLWVNAFLGRDRSAIIGDGAGFAILLPKEYKELLYITRKGESGDIQKAIKNIVSESQTPGALGRKTSKLVKEVIEKREDSLLN